MAFVYHGTPITPNAAFDAVMCGRGACVSFYRPDQINRIERICPFIMYDPGTASPWFAAMRRGEEWDYTEQDPRPYYAWLEQRIYMPGRWAIIYDVPGAPSQYNDGFLDDFPFGRSRGAPVWHMDGPLERLGRLADRYDRLCLGWIGDPKREPVGCDRYRKRMDEADKFFAGDWPVAHQLRGIAVAGDYPHVLSTDATSLGQNGHRHDWLDNTASLFDGPRAKWFGRSSYADRLEAMAA